MLMLTEVSFLQSKSTSHSAATGPKRGRGKLGRKDDRMSARNVPVAPPGTGYCLKWNHYQNFMTAGLAQLIEDEEYSLTDVTLGCDGQFINAHKIILSLCSPFFKLYFRRHRVSKAVDTLVLLTNIRFVDLRNIIHFIYHGEITINHADLNSFLEAANILQIQGLADTPAPAGAGHGRSKNESDTETSLRSGPTVSLETQSTAIPPLVTQPPSVPPNFGTGAGPPSKRSRLVSSSLASGDQQSLPLTIVSTATVSAMTKTVTGTVRNQQNSADISPPTDYDPLGDAADSVEEDQEEEMISFDMTVKPEPISVYTINDSNEGDDEDNSFQRGSDDGVEESVSATPRQSDMSGIAYHSFESVMEMEQTAGPSGLMNIQPRPKGGPRAVGKTGSKPSDLRSRIGRCHICLKKKLKKSSRTKCNHCDKYVCAGPLCRAVDSNNLKVCQLCFRIRIR